MERQAPAPREISFQVAMEDAVFFQKNGRLSEAEELYIKILDVAPDHPDALHFAGILAHQQGRNDDAVALIERSLEVRPDQADCYSNLGIIFKAQGRLEEAVAAYRHAIELNADHANAHCNLGVLFKAQGKPVEAEQAYRTALRLDPCHVNAYHNLGLLLAGQRRNAEAADCLDAATRLSPGHPEARRLLALVYCSLGQVEKAVEVCEAWLKEKPGDPVAEHVLAACSGQGVPARASDAYVETVYDQFAATFEATLSRLLYQVPRIVAATLADAGVPATKSLDVLDAGCGTGLCGSYLAPYARRLTGVDLSEAMLTQAREKRVYDELVRAELTVYLRAHLDCFDLIVAADTLCYFGQLGDVTRAAWHALRPDGLLVFTVEESVNAAPGATFSLEPHGRYSHARGYVERVLAEAGLVPEVRRADLRLESGAPVAGLVVRALKPAG